MSNEHVGQFWQKLFDPNFIIEKYWENLSYFLHFLCKCRYLVVPKNWKKFKWNIGSVFLVIFPLVLIVLEGKWKKKYHLFSDYTVQKKPFDYEQVLLFCVCVTTPVDLCASARAHKHKQQKKGFLLYNVTDDCVRSRKEGLLYTILHFSLAPLRRAVLHMALTQASSCFANSCRADDSNQVIIKKLRYVSVTEILLCFHICIQLFAHIFTGVITHLRNDNTCS